MEHFRGTAGSMIKTVNALFASFLSEKREKTISYKEEGLLPLPRRILVLAAACAAAHPHLLPLGLGNQQLTGL